MRVKFLLASMAAVLLLETPISLNSCGIAAPVPVFVTRSIAADPLGQFAKGRIGVIMPTFGLKYLIGAYRLMSGRSYTAQEAEAFFSEPPPSLDSVIAGPYGYQAWIGARNSVVGIPMSGEYLNPFKSSDRPGSYGGYRNCLDDAFSIASSTLMERAQRWGSESPNFRAWLTAQDQVFHNCSGPNKTIPADPDKDMDPVLAADREYQIAAAHFYAGDWEEARKWFARVAANPESSWSELAPYLIARVWLREGMVDEKQQALEEADRQFEGVTKNPALAEWHEASIRLRDFTSFRVRSWGLLKDYAAEFSGDRLSPDVASHLESYTYLYQHSSNRTKIAETSDLADWLLAYQGWYGQRLNGQNYAITKWRETRSPAWLIAALWYSSDDTAFPELLRAAHEVKPDHPAYDSVAYYGIGAAVRRGRRDEARQWADEALRTKLILSSRNRILYERLKLARNWDEFLRAAPRMPEPNMADYDGHEGTIPGPPQKWASQGALLDIDSRQVLNRFVPLELFRDAAYSPTLARHLQIEFAQAGFARALILGRLPEARAFIGRVVELQPTVASAAREFLSAPDDEASQFAAVLLALRTSGPSGILSSGSSGPSQLQHANYAGSISWGFNDIAWKPEYVGRPSGLELPLDFEFLTPQQRTQAEQEWKTLADRASCAATYVEGKALDWARRHPEDARVPEALYLTVRATFFGCREDMGPSLGNRSREAYNLLHQRYPNSEWTKKTPYWYK
jgi:tetratricopeptide (TPR) repeat protein